MAGEAAGSAGPDRRDIPDINTNVPHPARVYDYFLVLRDCAQVTSFFDGLELLEPGVVQLSKWRPRSGAESAAAAALWGGAARKPG